ncbi:MAG: DUF302 domain-containing protein [Rhodobacteraceae bacterium]|nr:MAG: DUF302 domain-containing protein [Paracoccaceae bacterium]
MHIQKGREHMQKLIGSAIAAMILAGPVVADGFFTVDIDAEFQDVVMDVEDAITNQGLVIDSISYVGQMLARTGPDLDADVELFKDAQIFSFCSATLSREVMEAKLRNLQFCPYNVYVYQSAEEGAPVVVGYREFNEPTMRPVNYLLQQIVAAATGSH